MRSSYLRFRLLLSNISDKMAFRIRKEKENRLKKHSKTTTELFGGSSKWAATNDDKTLQCHAPIVGCVKKGHPLPKSTLEGGVKMCCTNDKCEYARQLIHGECFEMLENHLIKIISNIGSARGWTELQRRHNLWEKKGLTLVQKLLRCKCDRGQMVRDTNFYKEEKDIQLVAKTEEQANNGNKSKKKKKKELPRLNFGYNSAVLPPSDNCDLYKKKFNELESHFLSSHYDNDDLSSVISSEPVIHTVQHKSQNSINAERRRFQVLRRQQEKEVAETVNVGELERKPEKQKQNVSGDSLPDIHPYLNGECNGETNGDDSGGVITDMMSCNGDDSQLHDLTGLQDLSSLGLSADGLCSSLLSSCSSMAAQPFQFQPQHKQQDFMPVYTLFGHAAPNFFLGERILANMHLPWNSLRG